jgi:hypothetical protein
MTQNSVPSSQPQSSSSIPSGTEIIWSGQAPEGKLILAVDRTVYSLFKPANDIYFRIESADMFLEGVIVALSGIHTADDLIRDLKNEWAKFTM